MSLQVDDLINFENEVAERFNAAKIRAPIHLYSNNEHQLIEVFEKVRIEDWSVLLLEVALPMPFKRGAKRTSYV